MKIRLTAYDDYGHGELDRWYESPSTNDPLVEVPDDVVLMWRTLRTALDEIEIYFKDYIEPQILEATKKQRAEVAAKLAAQAAALQKEAVERDEKVKADALVREREFLAALEQDPELKRQFFFLKSELRRAVLEEMTRSQRGIDELAAILAAKFRGLGGLQK